MTYKAKVDKNYKFYMFNFLFRWFVPFPIQVWIAKKWFGTCVWYQDTRIVIEQHNWYPEITDKKK